MGDVSERPRGDKASHAEVLRRLHLIEELYLRYGARAATIRAAATLPPATKDGPALQLSLATRRRYVSAIEARWRKEDAEAKPHQRADFIRFVRSVLRRAEARGDAGAVMQGLRLLANVLGLKNAEVVEVHAVHQAAPADEDLTRLTVDELLHYRALRGKAKRNGVHVEAGKPSGANGASN